MIPPFDLFRVETDGSVKWLGVCADLEAAKVRVRNLSMRFPAEYFIFSQATERRLFITPDGRYPNERTSQRPDSRQ
jgi:hypothetical protein